LEHHPFAEIRVGDETRIVRQVTSRDSQLFAAVSGDVSPAHVDAIYVKSTSFHQIIAHGMLGGSLISRVRALPC
jgi:acyl dehydratase